MVTTVPSIRMGAQELEGVFMDRNLALALVNARSPLTRSWKK
jgi:hypothetical protein